MPKFIKKELKKEFGEYFLDEEDGNTLSQLLESDDIKYPDLS